MSDSLSNCPKCEGTMEQGYTLDVTFGATFTGQWIRGTPKRSYFDSLAIKFPSMSPSQRVPIATFRCQSCGFLESYAREEFGPK